MAWLGWFICYKHYEKDFLQSDFFIIKRIICSTGFSLDRTLGGSVWVWIRNTQKMRLFTGLHLSQHIEDGHQRAARMVWQIMQCSESTENRVLSAHSTPSPCGAASALRTGFAVILNFIPIFYMSVTSILCSFLFFDQWCSARLQGPKSRVHHWS